jgi:hypothetical protein
MQLISNEILFLLVPYRNQPYLMPPQLYPGVGYTLAALPNRPDNPHTLPRAHQIFNPIGYPLHPIFYRLCIPNQLSDL